MSVLSITTVATKLHKRKVWGRQVTNRKVGNGSLGKEREQLGKCLEKCLETGPGTLLVTTNLVLYKKHTPPISPDLTGYARPNLT